MNPYLVELLNRSRSDLPALRGLVRIAHAQGYTLRQIALAFSKPPHITTVSEWNTHPDFRLPPQRVQAKILQYERPQKSAPNSRS